MLHVNTRPTKNIYNLAGKSEYTLSTQIIKNTCSFHEIDLQGKSYDTLLMSLVKSTSKISVDEWEETG